MKKELKTSRSCLGIRKKIIECLAGDINLSYSEEGTCAEVNIMVVEEAFRRKGISSQVIKFFMSKGKTVAGGENLKVIKAIIGNYNSPSIKLFQKLGFEKGKLIEAFNQTEYLFNLSDGERQNEG